MQALCYVGEKLGKTLAEVYEMSGTELHTWLAWFRLKNEEERKAHEKAKAKSRRRR